MNAYLVRVAWAIGAVAAMYGVVSLVRCVHDMPTTASFGG